MSRKLGHNGTFEDFLRHLKTDGKFILTDPVEHFRKLLSGDINPSLLKSGAFDVVKDDVDNVAVMPIPNHVSGGYAFYVPDNVQRSNGGTFFVNTRRGQAPKSYQAMSIALHEANPGHHLQNAHLRTSGHFPDFMSRPFNMRMTR